jgi:Icc protein
MLESMQSQAMQILQISDLHLAADTAATREGFADNWTQLELVLNHIRRYAEHAELLLATGDLVQRPDTNVYARLGKRLAGVDMPVVGIAGNHDCRESARSHFIASNLGFEGVFEVGNWVVISLNSAHPGRTDGCLDATEWTRLEETARQFPEHWLAVAVHHPPLPLGSPWLDRIGLENGAQLLAWLQEQPRARLCLFGHAHQEFTLQRSALQILGCPATSVQFQPLSKEFALAHESSGYRRIELGADGSVRSEVVRVPGTEPQAASIPG